MNTMDLVLRRTVQGTGIVQVVLGVTFWTGTALRLIPLHMLVGVVFILALWLLALRAALVGAGGGFAALVGAYGVFVIAFGMNQAQILPGPYHWLIRALHLMVGMGAMGLAQALWARMTRQALPERAIEAGAA